MLFAKRLNLKKSNFTLLEVMIAIALLLIASGVIGWKMHEAVRRKQFQSELERLRSRLTVVQKLAVAMQADWAGELRRDGKEWVFETSCEEGTKLSSLRLHPMEILFEGKKIDEVAFDFFASGKVLPVGGFSFEYEGQQVQWKSIDLFQREEGRRLGPAYPNE